MSTKLGSIHTYHDQDGRPTLDRLRDSGLITQTARVVWTLDTPDLARPDHHRLSMIKNNLGPFPPPIGMTIDENGIPQFGPPPEPPAAQTELDRAIHFLRDALAPGSQPANQLLADCHPAALSEPTVRRAKRLLGIASIRPPGQTEWYWTFAPGRKMIIPTLYHKIDHLDHLDHLARCGSRGYLP